MTDISRGCIQEEIDFHFKIQIEQKYFYILIEMFAADVEPLRRRQFFQNVT